MWQSEIDDFYRKSGRKVRATSDVQHTLEGLLAHQRDCPARFFSKAPQNHMKRPVTDGMPWLVAVSGSGPLRRFVRCSDMSGVG
jgi:hypothetical protein